MPESPAAPELVESYRRLADVFHEVLAEQSLDALLVRIADALHDLIPHDTLTIYEADEAQAVLTPVLARDQWVDEIQIMGDADHVRRKVAAYEDAGAHPIVFALPWGEDRHATVSATLQALA